MNDWNYREDTDSFITTSMINKNILSVILIFLRKCIDYYILKLGSVLAHDNYASTTYLEAWNENKVRKTCLRYKCI